MTTQAKNVAIAAKIIIGWRVLAIWRLTLFQKLLKVPPPTSTVRPDLELKQR